MSVIEVFGSWEGRIGRLVHAGAILALVIVYHVVLLLLGHPAKTGVWGGPHLLVAFLTIYPGWVIALKRAHDLGKSGLWLLGWSLSSIPAGALLIMGGLAAAGGSPGDALFYFVLSLVLSLGSIWQLGIKLFFFAGESGTNAYGRPPGGSSRYFDDGVDAAPSAAMMRMSAAMDASASASARTAQRPAKPAVATPAPQPRGLRPAQTAGQRTPGGFGRRGMARA